MKDSKNGKGFYRALYSSLLDDPEFRKLSSDARHVFQTLKFTRLSNMAGIFWCDEGGKVTISIQTGLTLERVEEALNSLSDSL
ncbi:MAG: hypothetical protein GY839_07730 [candidate division Zixibacteria bacterium]|nr:hypothetical protein [candidate division Zixibacteria bacterium]